MSTVSRRLFVVLLVAFVGLPIAAQAQPAPAKKPPLQIIPGKVIVPTDNMRRPWGELVSIDLATRTGKFRNEGTNEIQSFTVMPYAELLHHATLGDLQDYRVGERAIFRLHPNEAGEWVWLTYIQDEMNFLNGHKEYYWVDKFDAATGTLTCTDANADKSYVRTEGIPILVNAETRVWKGGQPAKLADLKVGEKIRTKTHGTGEGKTRVVWELFLDDESLLKFQAEQIVAHKERMQREGLPGYVDERGEKQLKLTIFPEARDYVDQLKAGRNVTVAPAGADRKPISEPATAKIAAVAKEGRNTVVTLDFESSPNVGFKPAGLFRLWLDPAQSASAK